MDKIRRKSLFQHTYSVSSIGRVGWLALLWSDPTIVQMISAFNNMIEVRVLHPSRPSWGGCLVYSTVQIHHNALANGETLL